MMFSPGAATSIYCPYPEYSLFTPILLIDATDNMLGILKQAG